MVFKMFGKQTEVIDQISGQTERSKQLLNIILVDCEFGDQEENVIKLVQAITGEDLESFVPDRSERKDYISLIDFAVFKTNTDSEIGDGWDLNSFGIIESANSDYGVRIVDGEIDDDEIELPYTREMSCPSLAEIIAFIDKLYELYNSKN